MDHGVLLHCFCSIRPALAFSQYSATSPIMAIATMHPSDIPTNQKNSMGAAVPAFTPHAISVSLPTWKDNVGYEEGEERVIKAMVNGYPRFFIHLSIQKVRGSAGFQNHC